MANRFMPPVYDLSVVCGRFGHEQIGHVSLFETARMLSKRTLILVGSSQEYGTLRNPFRVETRIDVIKETYPGESEELFMVRPLRDLTNEYDVTSDWGKFVKSEIEHHKHKFADLMVYGNDEFRSQWFAAEDLVNTVEVIIPRSTIPISGTQIRCLLLIDYEATWQKFTPALIHSMYPRLRSELMQVDVYKDIYNTIRKQDMSLENFMQAYKILEAEDRAAKEAQIAKMKQQP